MFVLKWLHKESYLLFVHENISCDFACSSFLTNTIPSVRMWTVIHISQRLYTSYPQRTLVVVLKWLAIIKGLTML